VGLVDVPVPRRQVPPQAPVVAKGALRCGQRLALAPAERGVFCFCFFVVSTLKGAMHVTMGEEGEWVGGKSRVAIPICCVPAPTQLFKEECMELVKLGALLRLEGVAELVVRLQKRRVRARWVVGPVFAGLHGAGRREPRCDLVLFLDVLLGHEIQKKKKKKKKKKKIKSNKKNVFFEHH
jgi:hypothetical protein